MACCCHHRCEPCCALGSTCCVVEQEPCPSRKSLFQIQGIFPAIPFPCEGTRKCPNKKQYWHPGAFVGANIPLITITEDDTEPYRPEKPKCEGKIVRKILWMIETKCYEDHRGPVLKIQGRKKDIILTSKQFMKLDDNGCPIVPEIGFVDNSDLYPIVEDLFVSQELTFSTTRVCKKVDCVFLQNEGTVAIRYMWLRSCPTRAMRRILGRPGNILNVKKLHPPSDNPFFWKDHNFEFHFRELPGVILPGQSIKFPIIFRPQRNGYFYEDLYLLTHPRLSDEDDYVFKLRLTGICMNPDCCLPPSKVPKLRKTSECCVNTLTRKILSWLLHNEAIDCLDVLLDVLLYNPPNIQSTLPNGKVTAEQIFYKHNPDMHYSFDVAEGALENVREVLKDLVPKDRIISNPGICPLSIQSIYNEIIRGPPPTDYFWKNFQEPKAEETLEKLNQQTRRLFKPRVFDWPSKFNRLRSSCYTTMVSTLDEAIAKISNIDFDHRNEKKDKVVKKEIRNQLVKKKQKEIIRERRRAEQKARCLKNLQLPGGGDTIAPDGLQDRGDAYETQGEQFNEEEAGEGFLMEPEIVIPDEEIEAGLAEMKLGQEKKSKSVLFETVFGCGVERMMSVVDTTWAMYDYRESPAMPKCEESACSNR